MSFFPKNTEQPAYGGHAALYLLFVLPIAITFTSVAVDISGWNACRDKLQQDADRIALQAANLLPRTEDAIRFIAESAKSLSLPNAEIQAFVPDDSHSAIGVAIRGYYRPAFAFVVNFFTPTVFSISRTAVAQIVPTDAVLVLSDGSSLRPPLSLPTSSAPSFRFDSWGAEFDWPAASYFSCVRPVRHAERNALGWNWSLDWNRRDFKRWATQSCFNPSFTPLKVAAIGIANGLSAIGSNRLAVIFSPGGLSDQGFRIVRHIHSESDDPTSFHGAVGGFPKAQSNRAQAHWGDYVELDQLLGDEACMLISEAATGIDEQYAIPVPEQPSSVCPERLSHTVCGGPHFVTGHFTDCYLTNALTLSQAIYWDAAKLSLPGHIAYPNISGSLAAALTELTDRGALPFPSPAELKTRGNSATMALRKIVVLTDFLPDPANGSPSLEQLVQRCSAAYAQLIVVSYFHPGLSPSDRNQLEQRFEALEKIAVNTPGGLLRVIRADDPESLLDEVGPAVTLSGQRVALRS
ncbi:MAG: hypothetical protein U0136_08290 [Bdellovibrionota bacterium]